MPIVALSLLAASCSKPEETQIETPTPTLDSVTSETAYHLQDIWMLFDVSGIDTAGNVESILADLVPQVAAGAQDPIALTEFLTFSPVPDVEAAMVSPDGEILEDIELDFGIFEMPSDFDDPAAGERTLGFVTSAPTRVQNVQGGDKLAINLDAYSAATKHETLSLDFLMGQARPTSDEEGKDALETLQARFAAQTVTWVGTDVAGNLEPAIWRQVPASKSLPTPEALALNSSAPQHMGSLALPGPVPARDSVPSVFDVKPAFTGKGGLALTAFCFVGTLVATGGAGVLFGSVFCTLIGTMGALNDALDAIDDNNGGGNRHPGPSAGSWSDPHLTTFDGAHHPLMLVGEFDAAISEELHLQLRTSPVRPESDVTFNIAAAIKAGEDVIIIDVTAESEKQIRLNGQPLKLSGSEQQELANGTGVTRFGNAIDITTPTGAAVVITLHGSSLDATYYLPPDHAAAEFEVTGLFGDGDGDSSNDFFTRDGTQIPDFTTDQFYREIAESWRVSDADNLFDTPLTHDREFPPQTAEPPASAITWATSLCSNMGLTGYFLDACILDVSKTGDTTYVMRAMTNQSIHSPETFDIPTPDGDASAVVARLPNMTSTGDEPRIDSHGHALVSMRQNGESDTLIALDLDASIAWQSPMETTSCAFTASGDRALVTVRDDDGDQLALRILETSGGTEIDTLEADFLSSHECNPMLSVGDLVLISTRTESGLGAAINIFEPAIAYEFAIPHLQSPLVTSDDGRVWAVTVEDDRTFATEINPNNGKTVAKTRLPATFAPKGNAQLLATSDGFITILGDENGEKMIRFAGGSVAWETPFPLNFDGKEQAAPSKISANETTIAGYTGSQYVLIFDIATGAPTIGFAPGSFNNNSDWISHHGTWIAVGPFGGNSWIELHDARTGALGWSTEAPRNTNDVKFIHSLDTARIIAQSGRDGHGVVAIYLVP